MTMVVDLDDDFHENQDPISSDNFEKEVDELFTEWREDQEKLASRRRLERYFELKRLREQIGDIYELDDDF
ncbi:MAG: PA3496 family putative envelope integrity protein [Methylohalobius sp. ZOD2]